MKKLDWLFILILVFSSLWATKALWHVGLFTSHDGPHQVVRLLYYEAALKDGQFPPRYILPALKGFGYPLFIFSYHLPWMAAMPLRLLGLSIYDCIKILFIITFVISGLTMYFWQKTLWRSSLAGFVGAFLYLWAPYRFSDIYVRGALGEAMTFMFIPLVFHSNVIIGSLAIAGIILSHSLIFILLLPVILLYRMKQSFKVLLGGIGLSAFYLIPAAVLKNQTIFTKTITVVAQDFSQHFPTLKQLLYSRWDYGFSWPGTNDGMSFQVGIAQWVAVGLSLIFIFKKFNKQVLFFILFFIFSIIMMLPISKPIWQIVNKFAFIDYPWRYLFLNVFCASVIAGWLAKKNILFGVFLIFVALYTNRNHIRVNAWLDWPPETFIASGETSNTFDEYAPAWVNNDYISAKYDLIQITTGKGSWSNTIKKTSTIEFTAKNDEQSDYRVNVLYFPDVKLLVDGQATDYSYKTKGVLDFTVPQGQHQVFIEFRRTLLEKIALIVSTILAIGLFFRRTFVTFWNRNS